MKLRNNPLFLILHISKIIERELDRDATENCGMSHTDSKLLVIVGYAPDSTQNELAHIIGVSAPAISRQINKLEKDGLVKRKNHPQSRREVQVSLTQKGKKMHAKTNSYLESKLAEILKRSGGMSKQTHNNLSDMSRLLEGDQKDISKRLRKNIQKNN